MSQKLDEDIKELTDRNDINDDELTQQKEEERKLEEQNEALEQQLEQMQKEIENLNEIE